MTRAMRNGRIPASRQLKFTRTRVLFLLSLLIFLTTVLFLPGRLAAQKDPEEDKITPAPADPAGLAPPSEGGGYELQWVESLNEVLDKPLLSDEGVPGDLPKSARSAGVVSAKDQAWSLAPTIVEPLASVAGFDFRREGAADLVPVIRGLYGRRVAIDLDGYRLDSPADPPGLFNPLSAIDPFLTANTEIIRGPSPVVHGSGAMGGVVYIMTKRRTYFDNAVNANADFTGRFSTANEERSGNVFGEMNARDFLGVTASATARNLGRTFVGRDSFETGCHTDNYTATIDGYLGDRATISGTWHHMMQTDVPLADFPEHSMDAYRRWDIAMLSFRTQRLARALRYSRLTFAYGQAALDRDISVDRSSAEEKSRVDRWSADAILEMPAGKFLTFIYGGGLSQDTLHISPVGGSLPDGAVYRLYSFFLEPNIEPAKRIKIVPAIRFEQADVNADRNDLGSEFAKFRYRKTAFGGGATGRVQVTTNNSIFGGYMQSYRFPDLSEMAGMETLEGWEKVPTEKLDPEIARTADLGFRMHFPFVKGQVDVYRTWLEDMISTSPVHDDFVASSLEPEGEETEPIHHFSAGNHGGARIDGIEGDMETYLGINWNWGLHLAYQYGEHNEGGRMYDVPPFIGNTHLCWTSDAGDFAMDVASRFAGEQKFARATTGETPGSMDATAPGYATLDLRVMASYTRYAEIRLGALNIAGAHVWHVGSRIPETGPNFIGQLVFHLN